MGVLNRRSVLAVGLSSLAVAGASMSRVRPFSAPDPGNIFYETGGIANTTVYRDFTGRTTRSLAINGSEDTLIMICAGQSLSTDLITDTFSPTNGTKLDNYVWFNGTNWAAQDALLGTSWNGSTATSHNFNFRVADGIISNGKFDRVIIVPVAMSGTTVNLWVNDFVGEPTGYYRMVQTAIKKLKAQGITGTTTGVKWLFKWNQGESDTQQSTTQGNYTTDWNKLKALVSVDLPQMKFMIAKETRYIGNNSAAVQAAQAAAVNGVDTFVGEDMDSIGAGGREGDDTHLNATGGNSAATMGIAAITAITF